MSNQQTCLIREVNGDDAPACSDEQRGARLWTEYEAADRAWERQHAAEWERVDQKLRGIAARRAALDAEEARLLRYADELKLWRAFGFGHMLEYVERVMGYAPHTAAERLRVARVIAELPLITEALENGELAHSAVRELSRVAIPDTEAEWLEAARGKSLREIEAMVSGRKPGHRPTDETEPRLHRKTITIEVSPETYDLWRKMHALAAEEHGQRLSDDELISSVFRRAYSDGAGDGGNSPAYKIAIKQCPDCKRAWQYSGGRDIEIDPAVAECATCDAIHLGSLDAVTPERITTTVTARKREQVLARDGHRCTVPGCRRNIGLDLHHIQFQSHGGSHQLSNLTIVCDLHHRAVHLGKLVVRGTAPDHLTFEFRKPRDRRNITDDDPGPGSGPHVSSSAAAAGLATPVPVTADAAAAGAAVARSGPRVASSAAAAAPATPVPITTDDATADAAAARSGPRVASSAAAAAPATLVQIRRLTIPPGGPTWESERRSLHGTADPWALDLVGTPRRLGFHRSSRWRTEPRDHPERTPKGDS